MMFYRDPDTGYYDPDEESLALHEAAEERRYLEELEASQCGEFELDLETGCTPAEMREELLCAPAFPIHREMEPNGTSDNSKTMSTNTKVA